MNGWEKIVWFQGESHLHQGENQLQRENGSNREENCSNDGENDQASKRKCLGHVITVIHM